MLWCHGGATSTGVMLAGVASPTEGVRRHDGYEVQMFDLWLFSMFGGLVLWVMIWF